MNQVGDFHHLLLAHASSRHCRGADADTTPKGDLLGVERNTVLIHRDAGMIEGFLSQLAVQPTRTEIYQHEVIIRTAGDDPVAVVCESACQRLCIADDLLRVSLE